MLTERIQAALAAEIKRFQGKGRVEREFGIRLSRVAKQGTSRSLAKALAAMGIPNVDEWIARRAHAPVNIPAILDSLPRPSCLPRPVAKLKRILSRQSLPNSPAPKALAMIEELDLLRYDDPHLAAKEARSVTLRASPGLEDTIRAGMAWASALRFSGDPMHAGLVLRELDPYAWRLGRRLEAELLQRIAPLLREYARLRESLLSIGMAQGLYSRAGDDAGVACTMVDRAACLHAYLKPEAAAMHARAALNLLPEKLARHRAAAHMLLGLSLRDPLHLDIAEGV